MGLIRIVLDFDIVEEKGNAHGITKRNWGSTRTDIESQIDIISNSVWDGVSKKDIAKAISRTIYTLTVMANESDIEGLVKEYLQSEHRQ